LEGKRDITIALIDSHRLFLEGMKKIIESNSNLNVIAIGRSKDDALQVIKSKKPNLLIIDLGLIELENLNRFIASDTKVLLLSGNEYDEDYVIKALFQGAKGLLLRSMQSELFMEAIVSVFQDRFWIHPNLIHCLIKDYKKLRKQHLEIENEMELARPLHPFTNREYEILKLLVEGYSNREIATKMGITVFTVKTHVRNILGKMHVNDRTNAVISAIRKGWVSIDHVN